MGAAEVQNPEVRRAESRVSNAPCWPAWLVADRVRVLAPALTTAVVLVQNFRPDTASLSDFEQFVRLFGTAACRDGICEVTCPRVQRLLFAWVDCPLATEAQLASLV